MKSALLNLIGIFGVTQELFGDSCGAANNKVPAIFKKLILGKGEELREIHETVLLSLYLIQLSLAHQPFPEL